MNSSYSNYFIFTVLTFVCMCFVTSQMLEKDECSSFLTIEGTLLALSKAMIPSLEGKEKGEAGKIGVIGGSTEYTGAPYFTAITALKTGADLVYVITTNSAAPVIKSYSPDLIVYPFLDKTYINEIKLLLPKMDIIVIGPGLGRKDETLHLIYDILNTCKILKKPLIIDADGLYAVSKNLSVISDYPIPGIIMTPNNREADTLMQAISNINNSSKWYNYWGNHVTVLVKGEKDKYYTTSIFDWYLSEGGSGRRVGGQGDILSGALATFYNWILKLKLCRNDDQSLLLAQSVAAHAASRFTRKCNSEAFKSYGRSMLASNMLNNIHSVFDSLFS